MTAKQKRMARKVVTFPDELWAQIQAYTKRRQEAEPEALFNETTACRILVARGLAAEKEAGR